MFFVVILFKKNICNTLSDLTCHLVYARGFSGSLK